MKRPGYSPEVNGCGAYGIQVKFLSPDVLGGNTLWLWGNCKFVLTLVSLPLWSFMQACSLYQRVNIGTCEDWDSFKMYLKMLGCWESYTKIMCSYYCCYCSHPPYSLICLHCPALKNAAISTTNVMDSAACLSWRVRINLPSALMGCVMSWKE